MRKYFGMTSFIKQAIIDKIVAIDDEQVLERIKEDIDYLTADANAKEVLQELSSNDKAELLSLANEPDDFETTSYKNFKASISRWLTK